MTPYLSKLSDNELRNIYIDINMKAIWYSEVSVYVNEMARRKGFDLRGKTTKDINQMVNDFCREAME
jgi:hypothetical protein